MRGAGGARRVFITVGAMAEVRLYKIERPNERNDAELVPLLRNWKCDSTPVPWGDQPGAVFSAFAQARANPRQPAVRWGILPTCERCYN